MTQIAPLGFEIDTAALLKGGQAADKLSDALNKAATATDKLDTKSAEAAAEVKKVAEAERQAALSAEQFGKAVVDAVTALTKEKSAAEAAAKALRDKEIADKKAADAARKAAEEEARRSTVWGRVTEGLKGMSGAAANSNQHVESLSRHLARMAQTVQAGPGGLSGGIASSAGTIARFAASLGPLGGLAAGAAATIVTLGGAYIGLNAALAPTQDRFALLEARMKNLYGSANTAKLVFSEIKALADKNAVAIDQAAEAYLRLARNNQAIGLTRREMIQLTDSVQMLGRVSGATTGELASGMLQFSQALASGRLNGDELRSVMENMPALAKAIADGMKVTVGQLRAMGAEGQLTGDKITTAILSQLPKIQKEFEGLPQTSEQAFTRVGNAWDVMVDHMAKKLDSSGVTQWFARTEEQLIKSVDAMVNGETTDDELARLRAQRDRARGSPSYKMGFTGYVDATEARISQIGNNMVPASQRERFEAEQALLEGASGKPRSRFEASKTIIGDIDPVQKKVSELQANIASLTEVWGYFRKDPTLFPREAEEQIKRYPGYIAMLKAQLQDTLPALEKFKKGTNDRVADAIKYGYQGADFAGDVRKLTNSGASESEAVGAVTQNRIISVNAQTAAINAQIEAEQKRAAAIGQGKAAEREAEASAKALTYQLETFGNVVNDGVIASVGAYKAALLGLASAQDAAAQKQSMLSAQMDLASAKAGAGALAAGGGSGAVSAAQRAARRAAEMALTGDATLGVKYAAEDIDRLTGENQQLRSLRLGISLRGSTAGMSPAGRNRAQQADEARSYSEGFSSPAQREIAYQTKLADLRSRDAATIREQLEDKTRAAELTQKEIELTKIGGIAAQVAIAREREMIAIRASGLDLTKQEVEARLKLTEQAVLDQDALAKAQESANAYVQMWQNAGDIVASSINNAFEQLFDGQRIKWKDLVTQMAKDLAMMLVRNQTNKLADFIGNIGSNGMPSIGGASYTQSPSIYGAGGVVAANQNVTAFGNGGLFNRPTVFAMANGAGLMAEAGPEAILPLKRGPDGKLGVGGGQSRDSGVSVVVNDMRSGGEAVHTQEERGADGKRMVRLTIRDEVKSQIKNGTLDPEMSSQYGARRTLARR